MVEHSEVTELVKLIEFEISRLRSEEKQPGWNSWILLGALAGTLWLGLSELEKYALVPNRVFLAFLTFYLAYDSIQLLIGLLRPSGVQTPTLRFSITKVHLAPSRIGLLVKGILYAMLSYIAFFNPLVGPPLIRYGALAFCLFFSLSYLLILMLTAFDLPILSHPPLSPVIAAFSLLYTAALTTGLIITLRSPGPTFPEIRVAALAVAVIICLNFLSRGLPHFPLLLTLIDVRRKLGLSQLDYSDARRQIEIALEGLQISDILQKEVDIILNNLREVTAVFKSLLGELRSLQSTIPNLNNLSPEQTILRDSVIKSAKSRLTDTLNLKDVDKLAMKRLRKKIIFVARPKQVRSEVHHFLDRLEAQIDESRGIASNQLKEIAELMNTLQPEKVSNGVKKTALPTDNT